MDKVKAEKEIKKLSRDIEEHNRRYYDLAHPTVTDKEYDDLLKRLIALEEEFPGLKDLHSPSQRVGIQAPAGGPTVKHHTKMYSLDNTYAVDEPKEWHARILKGLSGQKPEYVVELKIDGVSAALTYQDGNLISGATRGDGITGEY